jgi:hypothetical protein
MPVKTQLSGFLNLVNAYLDFSKNNFFGLPSYERYAKILVQSQTELANLYEGLPVIIVYYPEHKSLSEKIEQQLSTVTFQTDYGLRVSKIEIDSVAELAAIRPSRQTICIYLSAFSISDKACREEFDSLSKKFYYNFCLLSGVRNNNKSDIILPVNIFLWNAGLTKLSKPVISRYINSVYVKNAGKMEIFAAAMLKEISEKVILTLKRIDSASDKETRFFDAQLKTASLDKTQIGNTYFSISRVQHEKYIREHLAKTQKNVNQVIEQYTNADSGFANAELIRQIEDLDVSCLDMVPALKKKVYTVSIRKAEVDKLRDNLTGILQTSWKNITELLYRELNHLYEHVNKEFQLKNYPGISNSNFKLLYKRANQEFVIDNKLKSDYLDEISFRKHKGFLPVMQIVRENLFKYMMFFLLLRYLDVDFGIPPTYGTISEKKIKNLTEQPWFKNYEDKASQTEVAAYLHDSVKNEFIEYEVERFKQQPWLKGKVSNAFIEKVSGFIKDQDPGKKEPLIKNFRQGSIFAFFVFIAILIFGVIEYFKGIKIHEEEEKEKNLRNIKNDLKLNLKKIVQSNNKRLKDFTSELVNEMQLDLSNNMEMVKANIEEKELDASSEKTENFNNVKYYKLRTAELDALRKFNKLKMDESLKMII